MNAPPADDSGAEKMSPNHRLAEINVFNSGTCELGEGPAWDSDSRSLYWVDILGDAVYAASAEDGARRSWKITSQPSAAILTRTNYVIVPAGQKIFELCPTSGEVQTVAELAGEPQDNRCNDAKCDPIGNLWVGTMDNYERNPIGRLWRFNADGGKSVVLDGIGVANTLAWDMTRGRFYFADSMIGDIYKFDYDAECAEISGREVFFKRDGAPGVPDGSAIDSEGYLWNARWDGGCIVRISPDGELNQRIDLPTMRPTSCAFGGTDMKTLYVTSAAAGAPGLRDRKDNSGYVFSVEVDVPGSIIPPYNGPLGHGHDAASRSQRR